MRTHQKLWKWSLVDKQRGSKDILHPGIPARMKEGGIGVMREENMSGPYIVVCAHQNHRVICSKFRFMESEF